MQVDCRLAGFVGRDRPWLINHSVTAHVVLLQDRLFGGCIRLFLGLGSWEHPIDLPVVGFGHSLDIF